MDLQSEFSSKAERDKYLVKEAIAGDQRAYAMLLSSYRDSLFFMMNKMVNNPDDAEDLTIEAFGKAFNLLESYRGKYAFSTWLFKIATNHCIDFIRKQKKHQQSTKVLMTTYCPASTSCRTRLIRKKR
jgi:RNA polymerase sigma-70 factor (ECF subfamily)